MDRSKTKAKRKIKIMLLCIDLILLTMLLGILDHLDGFKETAVWLVGILWLTVRIVDKGSKTWVFIVKNWSWFKATCRIFKNKIDKE